MTDRLLRALECPHLRVLGHPTGRILLQRDAFPFDFDRVVAEAVRRGVWLEINASPERLDLHGPLIRSARAKGARFTISTDAHHPKHLANMRYGVLMARRGWLGPADILNTLPADRFRRRAQKDIMKITSSREVYKCSLFRVTEDRAVDAKTGFRDPALGGPPCRLGRHDGGGRAQAHPAGAAIPAARGKVSLGTAGRPPRSRARNRSRPPNANWPKRPATRLETWTKLASFFVSPGYVQERMTIYLATGSDRRRGHAHGRRAHRNPLVHRQGTGRNDPRGKIEDAKDDGRLSSVARAHGAVRSLGSLLPRQSRRVFVRRSRNFPRRLAASETAESPNLSRILSAAARACFQLSWRSSQQVQLRRHSSHPEACTPSRRTAAPFFQLARNKARISSNSSVSSWVARAIECARVMVEKSV